VADTFAALTRPRPHRAALGPVEALAALRAEAAGGRLAAKLVDLLDDVVNATGPASSGASAEFGGDADGLPPLAQTSDGLALSF
jgi:HD-GYP domain-containing protein (c-di-GMP phosphodiesterase class II)